MVTDQLKIYFWLLSVVASNPTREDIDRLWRDSSLNDKHQTHFPERSLYRYLQDVEYVFGVEIRANRKGSRPRRFYLVDDGNDALAMNRWITGHLSMQQSLLGASDVAAYVLYEDVPEGALYLSAIVEAMRHKQMLQIAYRKFGAESEELTLAPYCIRMFKQRWYVVGVPSTHPDEIRTYALDRVLRLETTTETYKRPTAWSAKTYFKHFYGVFHSGTPCEVKIRATARSAAFLRSLPLHHSQQEMTCEEAYSVFRFYIAPTLDFIQELRTHGAQVEVLSPQWLREQMAAEARAQAALYDAL